MLKKLILEACVESLEEAVFAEKRGVDRIELCSRLDLDGLTPDRMLIKEVVEKVNIPVKVMIRPRAGNFIYSDAELEEMKDSIRICKKFNLRGVVFGILDIQNHLNLEQINMLAELASPLEVTIHKAIDLCEDPAFELNQLKKIKQVHSVLTSGKASTAIEGREMIKKMITVADTKIKIIAAGKVTSTNLSMVQSMLGADEYHGRKIVGDLNN